MSTPTGLPAWSRTADATVYGGHENKRDYQAQGVVNPETDVSAAEFKRLCADMAAVVRVAPFAVLRIVCDDAGPGEPTVTAAFQQTGGTITGYVGDSAPTGFPSVERNGDGDVTIIWDESYADEFGVTSPISIRMVMTSIGNELSGSAPYEILSEHSVRVRAFDEDGDPLSNASICVEVWA